MPRSWSRAFGESVFETIEVEPEDELPWPWIDPDKALPWVEQRSGLELADSQRRAIDLALTSKVLVVTGGPGVGKTNIVKSILQVLAAPLHDLTRDFERAISRSI